MLARLLLRFRVQRTRRMTSAFIARECSGERLRRHLERRQRLAWRSADLATECAAGWCWLRNMERGVELYHRALELDPDHNYAKVSLGIRAWASKDYATALDYFEDVDLNALPEDHGLEKIINDCADECREKLGAG